MASPTLQFKRGLAENLIALRAGEPGFTTNRSDFYIGIGAGTTASNKFFGSARYWKREDGTNSAELKLVDEAGNNGVSLRSQTSAGAGVTYTLPVSGTSGHFLRLGTSGVLEWASTSSGVSLSNASFTGVTTFTNLVDAKEGINVAGGLNVTSGVGTISSADINGGTIDGTVIGGSTAAAGTFTELTYNNSTTSGISTVNSLYLDSEKVLGYNGATLTLYGIEAIDATTKQTLEDTLKLDPNDFDSLVVSGIATFQSAIDAKGGIGVTGGESTFSSATVSDLTAGRVVLAGTSGSLEDSSNLTFGGGGLIVGAGGINVTGVSTFSTDVKVGGDLEVTGNDIKSSSATAITLSGADVEVKGDLTVTGNDIKSSSATAITLSAADVEVKGDLTVTGNDIKSSSATAMSLSGADVEVKGDLTVTGNDIKSSSATAITLSAADVEVKGDLQVTGNDIKAGDGNTNITMTSNTLTTFAGDIKVGGNDIQASDGSTAITLSGSNVTVTGDLTVKGTTTTVNTQTVLVKDSLIELGLIDSAGSLVPPTTDANIDVGMVFHYYSGSAKKAAVYWDDSTGRIAFADDTSEAGSVLTAASYATVLAGGLEINNACSGGTKEVIGCQNGELTLSNVVIDGGSFV